ncbi:MAG: hypothetical protein WBO82_04460 [Neisseria sp.]
MMNRMAVNLKQGQHVIMPSGQAAKVVDLLHDMIVLKYLESNQPVTISRLCAAKWWPA